MKNKHQARVRRGAKTKAIQLRNPEKPRLVLHRSNAHIYSQIVIRQRGGSDKVIVCASTLDTDLRANLAAKKLEQAAQVGKLLGERAKKAKVKQICFDRRGYKYHGRVKALAEGAREAGLIF